MLLLVMVFNIFVALALGFVFGRIYQIRRDELTCRAISRRLRPPNRLGQPTKPRASVILRYAPILDWTLLGLFAVDSVANPFK